MAIPDPGQCYWIFRIDFLCPKSRLVPINFESDEKRRVFFEKLAEKKAQLFGLSVCEGDEKVIPEMSYGDIFDALSLEDEFITEHSEEPLHIYDLEEIKGEQIQ